MDAIGVSHRISILVVDDDRDTAESQATVLALHGHNVRYAVNAREAIQEAIRFGPDVILLDLWMPEINGWELAVALKELSDSAILIAVSGCNGPEDLQRSNEVGIQFHMVKPVETAQLLAILDMVGKAQPRRANELCHCGK